LAHSQDSFLSCSTPLSLYAPDAETYEWVRGGSRMLWRGPWGCAKPGPGQSAAAHYHVGHAAQCG